MAGLLDFQRAMMILSGAISFELGRLDTSPAFYTAQQCADMKRRLEDALVKARAAAEGGGPT